MHYILNNKMSFSTHTTEKCCIRFFAGSYFYALRFKSVLNQRLDVSFTKTLKIKIILQNVEMREVCVLHSTNRLSIARYLL